jgi:large subunit ribosomal protein L25
MRVPLHFLNQDTCVGVKTEGGASPSCHRRGNLLLAANLPEFIAVDLKDVHVGTTLHLSSIVLPTGVEIPALALGHDYDQPIANVHKSTADA